MTAISTSLAGVYTQTDSFGSVTPGGLKRVLTTVTTTSGSSTTSGLVSGSLITINPLSEIYDFTANVVVNPALAGSGAIINFIQSSGRSNTIMCPTVVATILSGTVFKIVSYGV